MTKAKRHQLFQGDCLEVLENLSLENLSGVVCIFADPPDNIGTKYADHADKMCDSGYIYWLDECLDTFISLADIVWLSYNAKWCFEVGHVVRSILNYWKFVQARQCIQTFTFGQHRQTDFANCYRPLLLLKKKSAIVYPDQIRIPSWRQLNGDKRADPRGRVPGDVFDFPRVTGNSKQRRPWCPTQLHEGLVERCIKYSTKEGDIVLDPFAGTGTTLRVCEKTNRKCILIEKSPTYCLEIAKEHNLEIQNLAKSAVNVVV